MQMDVSNEAVDEVVTQSEISLKEVKYIQNIGRFERARSVAHAKFGACTLIFGENGWGKSTLADLLRSLTTNNPDIVIGRKTLAGGPVQIAILRFGTRETKFKGGSWTGARPRIAIFDSVFVNENVFSGDVITLDHLKNQYGMVVGEQGVRHLRRIIKLEKQNAANNTQIRILKKELEGIVRATGPVGMSLQEFLELEAGTNIDVRIQAKSNEVDRTKRAQELKNAPEPQLFPIPTETEEIRRCLHRTIEEIGRAALKDVRAHISKHGVHAATAAMTHESWLEAGLQFANEKECAFCGQPVEDRKLLDSYAEFFGEAYKRLATDVRRKRETFSLYETGQFRTRVNSILEQNAVLYSFWNQAGQIEPPNLDSADKAIAAMESAGRMLDGVLAEKQANLTESASGVHVERAIAAWIKARERILHLNNLMQANLEIVKGLKLSISSVSLPQLDNELKTLKAGKQRHDDETVTMIEKLRELMLNKSRIAEAKAKERHALTHHGRMITDSLGKTINAYLARLNAGFRIAYKKPNYRGKEPAASYQILINNVPVPPRSTAGTPATPTFKNTLSAGDKSTLALALFLAKIKADPALAETIVVLDDPFTSLDNFRRQFTAIEINKLCRQTAQTIVLCHDKSFLRLLWDKVGHNETKCLAIQTGAPGMTTLAPYDIQTETQPRHVNERMKIEEFVAGENHDTSHIRALLRTVCEDFYRRGDPGRFHGATTLDEIIRILEDSPIDYPYKDGIDVLREINAYSRREHHAEIEGDPSRDSSEEELKGYCRQVLMLTCGM